MWGHAGTTEYALERAIPPRDNTMTATGSPADSAPAGEAKPPDLTAGTRRPSEETSSPDGKKERGDYRFLLWMLLPKDGKDRMEERFNGRIKVGHFERIKGLYHFMADR
ncbi:unnamed protein product [Linum trigynum]|uniref:Uncharacterized protein n=1 Tax=Linum trigynum TaxID=586398 RepID=A0AAV2DFV7_9ROSI